MKKILLPFFFIGTLAMIVVMAKTGATLKTPATPMGIIDLEFAYNTTKTAAIIHAWAPTNELNNIIVAIYNTFYDFLFLFFYAGFLFLACKKIAANMEGYAAKAGQLIARCALLSGLLDVFENTGMLITLHGYTSSAVAFLTVFFSIIKWGLVIIAVLYLLTGLLVLAYRRIKK
jgi:hypothetical protein